MHGYINIVFLGRPPLIVYITIDFATVRTLEKFSFYQVNNDICPNLREIIVYFAKILDDLLQYLRNYSFWYSEKAFKRFFGEKYHWVSKFENKNHIN